MGIMDRIREKAQSWLQINPPVAMMINITEIYDFNGNAIKNRIWYRGEPNEIEQLYWQIPQHEMITPHKFWSSHPTPGMEMRKIHTGLPSNIVDILAKIVVTGLNDFNFEGSKPVEETWAKIEKENKFKKLLEKTVKETLYIGDGAWKLSLDSELSEYPIIEYYPGDRVDYNCKRGRIKEIIFKSFYDHEGETVELKEIYGKGYIRYELLKGGAPIDMSLDARFAELQTLEWDDDFMMAVPVKFLDSERWENRGQSIFDKKIDAFDAFDEVYSQWMDALRAGRTKTYIPDVLIPRDPNTGVVLKPNAFDNRYIQTGSDMREKADNKIVTEAGEIRHDSYIASYTAALDLCLQGLLSPSTLGVDVKKLDNAEAQREKEKATLYTRDAIIEAFQPQIEQLIEVTLKTYFKMTGQAVPEYEVDVSFQDYANPSFESQIETIGKGRRDRILSIEACVDELYGDDKDAKWKEEEIARLKAEQGLVDMEEPAVNADAMIESLRN